MKLTFAPAAALTLAAAVVAGSAVAQSAFTHDPAQVPAGAYKVEPAHTRVLFSVTHFGFTDYYGQFNGVSGDLTLNPANPAASAVSVSIPTESITTSNNVLDGELRSSQWLDAKAFPVITFKSTGIKLTGKDTALLSGDFTLHGVTRPVVLDARFNAGGPGPFHKPFTVGFNATAHLKRSDFGVKTYVPMVGDDVSVIISAAFEKVG
jgi:polyisoprenoid-binding protein YceI